jgi:hypothetical protein
MTSHQVDLDASARADDPARDASRDDGTLEIASDLAYRRLAIVNVVFSGQPGARDQDWALIDAGLFGTKALIRSAAEHRFGPTLVAGDAFVTTRQESVYAALTQEPEMHGPPVYYTPDWGSARESVRRLASLQPELVVTGHGRAMRGPQMRMALASSC